MSPLAALSLPLLLLPIMAGVFALSARLLGAEAGYLLGFGCYWLFWCLLVPRRLLGKDEFGSILRDRIPLFSRPNWPAVLLWLLITLVAVLMYAGEFVRAPQTVFPAENVIGFVLSTFFLALPYGYIAYRTGSAKWTAISHSLSGILALSGYLAPGVLALIGGQP